MNCLKFIVSNQNGESISIRRIKLMTKIRVYTCNVKYLFSFELITLQFENVPGTDWISKLTL